MNFLISLQHIEDAAPELSWPTHVTLTKLLLSWQQENQQLVSADYHFDPFQKYECISTE